MNEQRFTDSISISTESQHKLIGLEYFKWHMSVDVPRLDIYYKNILLESHTGDKAIELYQQFHEDESVPKHLSESEVRRIAENVCRVSDSTVKSRDMYVVFSRYLFFHYFNRFTEDSLQHIGNYYLIDHSTVIHGLKKVRDNYLNGWRHTCKLKFENEINRIHNKIGITKIFK